MPGKLSWGYYPTTGVWLPIQVDSSGRVKVDMSAINLDDLANVYVPLPGDDYFLYYDQAASLWKARALVDADIPATIARDSEVTAAIATHAALGTGVHAAGSNYLALFGQAATVVTKFTAVSISTELWRRDNAGNSSFEALINGDPTPTSVVYDNDVRETSLPDPTTRPQWGKVILRNVTRGTTRKITNVNTTTNTITTEASADTWANNDIITLGSSTCVYTPLYTYSHYFDVDISANVPTTATTVLLELFIIDLSHADPVSNLQNCFGGHPFTTYAAASATHIFSNAAYGANSSLVILPVTSQKICLQLGAFGLIPVAGAIALARLRGYWE